MLKKQRKKRLSLIIALSLFLSSCASTNNNIGYKSSGYKKNYEEKYYPPVVLDVLIPVFDGGIEKVNESEIQNFNDIRRAESIHFAVKLKNKIKDRKVFVNPKVMPSARAFADIYVFGNIIESNGRDLKLKIRFEDAQGIEIKAKKNKSLKTYKGNGRYEYSCNVKCRNSLSSNPRIKKGGSPFDIIFSDIAKNLEFSVQKRSQKNLFHVQKTKELRFARFIAPEKFGEYIETKNRKGKNSRNTHKLIFLPDDSDPMFVRSNAIKLREQVFVDDSQEYIENHVYDTKFLSQYSKWQDQNAAAIEAEDKARSAQVGAAIGGVLLLALAVYGASEGNSDAAAAGAVGSGLAFQKAKKFGEEAKMYSEAISEMNIDINNISATRNMKIENQVFKERGTIEDTFESYGNFLKQVYSETNLNTATPLYP